MRLLERSLRIGASSSTTRILCGVSCRVIGLFLRLVVAIDASRSHWRGQEHAETGTAAGSVVDLDAATMCENDGLADGQAKAVAGHLRLPRRLVADEGLENAL